MPRMIPEEAALRRDSLIQAGYVDKNPQRRAFETIADMTPGQRRFVGEWEEA